MRWRKCTSSSSRPTRGKPGSQTNDLRFKQYLDELHHLYIQVTNTYIKLSSVTFDIGKIYEDYNTKSPVCKLPNNQKIYSSYNSSFKNLAEYYRI